MTTRHEAVRLSFVDDSTAGVLKAAAAYAVLDKAIDSVDGSTVGSTRSTEAATKATKENTKATTAQAFQAALAAERASRLRKAFQDQAKAAVDVEQGVSRATVQTDRLGIVAIRGSKSIDQFSGRLGLLAKAAAVLGPSLIPIGAVAVPAVAGLASQLGFAAIAAGTAVAAFQGVGDAMKALNEAQLDPTVKNLIAAREALQLLSPAGRDLVQQLDSMGPILTGLRDTAQAGMFPGLIQGLESLKSLAPTVNGILETVSGTLGKLIGEGADSLAGDRWADFFAMIQREAAPALTDMASAMGSVIHGLSELWEAFAPLNRDFGSWLAGIAADFDRWAEGLSETQGFKDFVEYIRTNGPILADAMGSVAEAVIQIVQAAAPLGGPVLQAIAGIADAFAAIADSPLGTPIMAAVTAMSALSLASTAATASVTRLNTAMAALGVTSKATGASVATGVGAAGAAGAGGVSPWAAPILLSLYSIKQEWNNLSDLFSGDMPAWEFGVRSLLPLTNIAEDLGVNIGFLGDKAEDARLPIRELANSALAAFERAKHFGEGVQMAGDALTRNTPALARFDRRLEAYNQHLRENRQAARQAAEGFVDFGRKASRAEFTLDGWLDKLEQQTDAMRNFRRNAEEAGRKGLDEGLIQHLRELGPEGALQMRRLANASETQIGRANKMWGSFQRESRLAGESVDTVQRFLDNLGNTHPKPKITVKGAPEAAAAAARVKAELDLIKSKSVTVSVNANISGALQSFGFAEGGYTGNRPRHEPAGVVHGREVVLPEDIVQRDKSMLLSRYGHLPNMAGLRGYADGGLVTTSRSSDLGGGISNGTWTALEIQLAKLTERFERATRQLRMMEKALERQEKAIDKQREVVNDAAQAIEDTLQKMVAFGDDISGRLTKGLFEGGTDFGSVIGTLRGNQQAGNQWTQALFALQQAGLDGPALQALLQQADLSQLTAVASWSPEQIAQFEALFGSSTNATNSAGNLSSQLVFGAELAENRAILTMQEKHLREQVEIGREMARDIKAQERWLSKLEKRQDRMEKLAEQNPKETGKETAKALNDVAGSKR